MINILRFICMLIPTLFFVSNCYAMEIIVKYNKKEPGFEYSGEPETILTLKTKGMRKVGSNEIITDWEEHQLNDDDAPSQGTYVVAKCTPSAAWRFDEMTEMTPTGNMSAGKLVCNKGEGISVIVVLPDKTQDYEYVGELTINRAAKDDKKQPIPLQTVMSPLAQPVGKKLVGKRPISAYPVVTVNSGSGCSIQ